MKETLHSQLRTPNFLRRFISLIVAEAFLCSSILPIEAAPLSQIGSSLLRPRQSANDGGETTADLLRELKSRKITVTDGDLEQIAKDGGKKSQLWSLGDTTLSPFKNLSHLLATLALTAGGAVVGSKVLFYRSAAQRGEIPYFDALGWLPDVIEPVVAIQGVFLLALLSREMDVVERGRMLFRVHLAAPVVYTIAEAIGPFILGRGEPGATFRWKDIAAYWLASGLSLTFHSVFASKEITLDMRRLWSKMSGGREPRARDGGRQEGQELSGIDKETDAVYWKLPVPQKTIHGIADELGLTKAGAEDRMEHLRKSTGEPYTLTREAPLPRTPGVHKSHLFYEKERLRKTVGKLVNGGQRAISTNGDLMAATRFFQDVVLESKGRPKALRNLAKHYLNVEGIRAAEKSRVHLETFMTKGTVHIPKSLRQLVWRLILEAYETFGGDPMAVAKIRIKQDDLPRRGRVTSSYLQAAIELLHEEGVQRPTRDQIAAKLGLTDATLKVTARQKKINLWKLGAARKRDPASRDKILKTVAKIDEDKKQRTRRIMSRRIDYSKDGLHNRLKRLGLTAEEIGLRTETTGVINDQAIDEEMAALRGEGHSIITRPMLAESLGVELKSLYTVTSVKGIDLEAKGVTDGRGLDAQERRRARLNPTEPKARDGGKRDAEFRRLVRSFIQNPKASLARRIEKEIDGRIIEETDLADEMESYLAEKMLAMAPKERSEALRLFPNIIDSLRDQIGNAAANKYLFDKANVKAMEKFLTEEDFAATKYFFDKATVEGMEKFLAEEEDFFVLRSILFILDEAEGCQTVLDAYFGLRSRPSRKAGLEFVERGDPETLKQFLYGRDSEAFDIALRRLVSYGEKQAAGILAVFLENLSIEKTARLEQSLPPRRERRGLSLAALSDQELLRRFKAAIREEWDLTRETRLRQRKLALYALLEVTPPMTGNAGLDAILAQFEDPGKLSSLLPKLEYYLKRARLTSEESGILRDWLKMQLRLVREEDSKTSEPIRALLGNSRLWFPRKPTPPTRGRARDGGEKELTEKVKVGDTIRSRETPSRWILIPGYSP